MSTIVTRGGKGAPLTQGEMDGNFVNLNTDKVETASNLGATGAAVFESKADGNLAFRKIVAGTNVTVTQNANDITIDASGGGGASTPAAVSDQTNTSTGYFGLPAGTTAQRPVSPIEGSIRENTTINALEFYNGTNWVLLGANYLASYLLVGGGGGGGGSGYANTSGGGGGSGGAIVNTTSLTYGVTYTVVVGAGGSGGLNINSAGTTGDNSSAFGATAYGGGGGGAYGASAKSGGSGGGVGSYSTLFGTLSSGTSGQGYAGGAGVAYVNSTAQSGGGGGGANGVGGSGSTGTAGSGGIGISSSITGASVNYAGGGGGGGGVTIGSASYGGGAGGKVSVGAAGTANTGGGGGGSNTAGGVGQSFAGGAGGSGIVILSVPTANYTGILSGSPTVTTSGSNTIIKFTSSGSYTA